MANKLKQHTEMAKRKFNKLKQHTEMPFFMQRHQGKIVTYK